MMVALLGDVLLCTLTQRCVVSTLGVGGDILDVYSDGNITLGGSGNNKAVLYGVTLILRRGAATLGSGGKPGGEAGVMVCCVSV